MGEKLKVSIQTGDWYDDLFGAEQGVDEAFAFVKACGFDTLDYNLDHNLNVWKKLKGEAEDFYDTDVEEILEKYRPVKEAMEKHGISIGQAHATFPLHVEERDDINDYLIMAVEKECAICHYLGCPALVVHPYSCADKEKEREINLSMYRKMIPAAKKYGVKLCLENMFRFNNGHGLNGACAEASEACWYIDTLNAEAGEELFGYCFDVGHANLLSRDLRQEIKTLGHRLTILHIHDNDGLHDLHQAPFTQNFGGGNCTDWEGFLDGLREISYQGTLNFETFAAVKRMPKELVPAMLRWIYQVGEYFRKQLLED